MMAAFRREDGSGIARGADHQGFAICSGRGIKMMTVTTKV